MLGGYWHHSTFWEENNKLYDDIANECSYDINEAIDYSGPVANIGYLLYLIGFTVSGKDFAWFYGHSQSFYEGMILYVDLSKFSKEEKEEFIKDFANIEDESKKSMDEFFANYKKHLHNIIFKSVLFFCYKECINQSIIALTNCIADVMPCLQSEIKFIKNKYLNKVHPEFIDSDLYDAIFEDPDYYFEEIERIPPYFYGKMKGYNLIANQQISLASIKSETSTNQKVSRSSEDSTELIENCKTNDDFCTKRESYEIQSP
ncbi:hypothetical protein TVAG_024910 [Trichomonas vaginalis G3]|uniref:Uncharacterized protein n=1 Tax=Trichomonas vaginalis (strain ATCC PRA-98 / G3) TaxID=412133 RepID=A2G9V3_TRIV3|nr:hypothetical protein TVAGG3_0865590 [Trichomonas vaginalis G3]EAX86061.1 hypothetical protein TVAG_024910 [Trichomonas vaginalis G3]KAI5501003.1 hypothetical protein TVAGG3_0865590 [Trichomonas vaginalis G3]|eukprot:XP_001298991.1 hypothetical protein [Trichomonas vaginalis G3]